MHSSKKSRLFMLIMAIIVLLGFFLGILYYLILDNNIKQSIIDTFLNLNNLRINDILKDLLIMSLLLTLSFFIIGIPIGLFYLIYDGFTLGFIFLTFLNIYKIKGIFYILIYFLFCKIPIIILMFLFLRKIINIGRLIIGMIIYKKEITIKEKIINNFINALYIILFVLIINILKYLLTPLFFSLLK